MERAELSGSHGGAARVAEKHAEHEEYEEHTELAEHAEHAELAEHVERGEMHETHAEHEKHTARVEHFVRRRGMSKRMWVAWARIRLKHLVGYLRTSLWTWPVASIFINYAIGTTLSAASVRIEKDGVLGYTFLFHGSPAQCAAILTYVGGFSIAITGTVFSLSIVAFQVAGVVYSPRVMQTFMRQNSTRAALATFLGTFSFSYAALMTVKDEDDDQFAPILAVNVLALYILAVVVALVYYLDYTVNAMTVAKILDEVAVDTIAAAKREHSVLDIAAAKDMQKARRRSSAEVGNNKPGTRSTAMNSSTGDAGLCGPELKQRDSDSLKSELMRKSAGAGAGVGTRAGAGAKACGVNVKSDKPRIQAARAAAGSAGRNEIGDTDDSDDVDLDDIVNLPVVPPHAYNVTALTTGYLISIDAKSVVDIAKAHHLVMRFRPRAGEYIVEDTTIAWVWRRSDHRDEQQIFPAELDSIATQLTWCVSIGPRRSVEQDIPFGIKQIVDIALKALSKGAFDPSTAVEALDRMERLFAVLILREMNPKLLNDSGEVHGIFHCHDEGHHARVVVAIPTTSFEQNLDRALDPFRAYGSHDVTVARRMLYLLGTVGSLVAHLGSKRVGSRLRALDRHIELILEQSLSGVSETSAEREAILSAAAHAYHILHGGKSHRVRAFSRSHDSQSGEGWADKCDAGTRHDDRGAQLDAMDSKTRKMVASAQENEEAVIFEDLSAEQQGEVLNTDSA
mmetsp:Transcript_10430/g.27757  ORF Transcript_10430/g.27757 Transcript_10430/m.27757 type:complete len:737 (-) Transcript_10430:386-2596(-)